MAAKGGFFMASHKGDFPYAKMANNMILGSMSEVHHDPKEINLLRQYRRMRQRRMLPDPPLSPCCLAEPPLAPGLAFRITF
jgi:hypothetical protein